MIIVFRGSREVQKEEPNEEAIEYVSEEVSFFSFQTEILVEWEIKEIVHEEMKIAGSAKNLAMKGRWNIW